MLQVFVRALQTIGGLAVCALLPSLPTLASDTPSSCADRIVLGEVNCQVPLVALIADPVKYEERYIYTKGYALKAGEELVVCLSPRDYFNGMDDQCVGLSANVKSLDAIGSRVWQGLRSGEIKSTSETVVAVFGKFARGKYSDGQPYVSRIVDIKLVQLVGSVGSPPGK